MYSKIINEQKRRTGRKFNFKVLLLAIAILLTQSAPADAQSETMRFAVIGDFGSGNSDEQDVTNLVKSWSPEFIVTVGDNNYPNGEAATIDANIGQFYHDFIFPYTGTYGAGAATNRFFPALGNHDWVNSIGAPGQPYFNYFTLPGNERYYDFVRGEVHFFIIDSDSHEPDGITETSVQGLWLRNKLAASTAQWKIVYMHHPPYSSRTSWTKLQWSYQQWGATAVIAGHAHVYERIMRNGFPYFTNGLGGESTGSFNTVNPGSVVRFGSDYGAMLVKTTLTSINFQFITRAGVVIDNFTVIPGAVTVPTAPTNLTATTISASQISLSWTDASTDETGFKIERCAGAGCSDFSEIAQTVADINSYQDTGSAADTTYQYRVRTFNNNGNSAYSNTAAATTVFLPPSPPSDLVATAVSNQQINLAWTDNSTNESGFAIERCTGDGCADFAEISQVGVNVKTYSSTGLLTTTVYRYRVRAFNSAGSSEFSNFAQTTTLIDPPAAPTVLTATAVSSTEINLAWTDNSTNESGFRIERCKNSGCTAFVQIAQVGAGVTVYSDANARKNSTYQYRILSFNAGGDSAYSNTAQTKTPR